MGYLFQLSRGLPKYFGYYLKKYMILEFFKGEEIKLLNPRELLKFTASDRQMSGLYECSAANGVGEPAVARIELNIICIYQLLIVCCIKIELF